MRKFSWSKFFAAAVLLGSTTAFATSMQCIELKENSVNDVEIKASGGYENCFLIERSENLKNINVLSKSAGYISHSINIFEVDQYGRASHKTAVNAGVNGVGYFQIVGSGVRKAIGILPTDYSATNKHLSVTYTTNNGVGAIYIELSEPSADGSQAISVPDTDPPTTEPIPTPTPPKICKYNACNSYLSLPKNPSGDIRTLQNNNSPSACSAAGNIPAGKNPNFDIDANIAEIERVAAAIRKIPDPINREAVRATVMISLFYTNRKYDLKNNQKFRSSQEFGNYFYGMAAGKMGYSELTALKAGALVQQVQNYKPGVEGNIKNLVSGLITAALTGEGDNPDDPPQISAGYQAGVKCGSRPSSAISRQFVPVQNNGLNLGWSSGVLVTYPSCIGYCRRAEVTVGPIIPMCRILDTILECRYY